jgi:hypothetical protein
MDRYGIPLDLACDGRVTTSTNIAFSSSSTVGFWQSVVTARLLDWHLSTYGCEPYRDNWHFGHGELL